MIERVAVFNGAGRLAVKNLELARQRGQLLGAARGQGDEAFVKAGHVGFEHFGRVARGVQRDEDALQPAGFGAQFLARLRQLQQRGGAHVGALGVAEENHHDFAFEIGQAARLAIGVDQVKVAGIGRVMQRLAAQGGAGGVLRRAGGQRQGAGRQQGGRKDGRKSSRKGGREAVRHGRRLSFTQRGFRAAGCAGAAGAGPGAWRPGRSRFQPTRSRAARA